MATSIMESIKTEAGWCKNYLGLRDDGSPCIGLDTRAVKFCVRGAIQRIDGFDIRQMYYGFADELAQQFGYKDAADFNNSPVTNFSRLCQFIELVEIRVQAWKESLTCRNSAITNI